MLAPAPRAGERGRGLVRGTLTIQGKSLALTHVWLVRGSETSDESKPAVSDSVLRRSRARDFRLPDHPVRAWDTVKQNAAIPSRSTRKRSRSGSVFYRLSPGSTFLGRRWRL
jgi:hypothetical protein